MSKDHKANKEFQNVGTMVDTYCGVIVVNAKFC